VWANELDHDAATTYRVNFGEEYLVEKDIRQVNPHDIPDFDVLVAGFPCQPFSIVGRQKGFNDPRGNLFFEILRIAKKVKPRIVFLENVANLLKHDEGKTFKIIKESLESLKYHVSYQIMNAKEYGGVPQQRNRIYIVAFKFKKDLKRFSFPSKIPLKTTAFDYYDKSQQDKKYYMDGHRMWSRMMEYMNDKKRVYRFTDWGLSCGMEGICPTLLAAMGSRFERIPFFFDDYSVRLMTPRECARLQGFPEDYSFPDIAEREIYKQIGNSVCVPLVRTLAEKIILSIMD
jgi:DNA (cytosine-5)-methyltransferase 1